MTKQIFFLAIILISAPHRVGAAAIMSASAPARPSASAAGSSFNPIFSEDGRHLVFVSHANNLVTNDDRGLSLDVFVRDLVSSNTVLVSVSMNGFGGANADANYPCVSSNGQFVVFASRASNLVANDTNDASDVFVRDVLNGTTRLVSVDVNGNSPADPAPSINVPLSGSPQISADGRWVFFESRATNLVADGAPLGSVNIYARDTWSNMTVLVTADTNGLPLADTQLLSGISADGRFAAFISSNLAVFPGVTNTGGDAYVHDLQTGVTIWASTNIAAAISVGTAGNAAYVCRSATLNEDGGYVVVDASSVSASGASSTVTIIRQDMANSGVYLRIGTSSAWPSQISADGRFILYQPSGLQVYDCVGRTNQQVGWISTQACGGGSSDGSGAGSLSRDGRSVAFRITEGYVCDNVTTPIYVYRRNLDTGETNLVAVKTNGAPWDSTGSFLTPAISPDGSLVAFDSTANDLALDDLNGASDTFIRDVNAGVTELISKAHPLKPAATAQAIAKTWANSISSDGRFLVFTRYDDPSVFRDTNGWSDVFITDLQNGTVRALSIDTNFYSAEMGYPATNSAPNTNAFFNAMISADGNAVGALRLRAPLPTQLPPQYELVVARASNHVFGSGMTSAAFDANHQSVLVNSVAMSGDGLLLAFSTPAPQVTSMYDLYYDNNDVDDVYIRFYGVRAINGGVGTNYSSIPTNFLLSVSTNLVTAGNGVSRNPVISLDGRWVAFETTASDLVPNSVSVYPAQQLVLADLGTAWQMTNDRPRIPKHLGSYAISFQEFQWVDAEDTNVLHTNRNAVFDPLAADVVSAQFSGNQQFVFFGLTNREVWRHDLTALHTNVVLVRYTNTFGMVVASNVVPGLANVLACTNCGNPSVSADGNIVVYERVRAGSGIVDLFAKDLSAGEETLVSAALSGTVANGSSTSPLVSGDGRYVVFQSKASDLVTDDSNGCSDIFVRDRVLGVTVLVSANARGSSGNGPSTGPVLGADGRTVAFQSSANDLISGDYNDKRDVFVLKLGGADTDGDGLDDDWEVAFFGNLSRDGSGDFDNDGASERAEFLAGTDPTNGDSIFRVLTVSSIGGNSTRVIWIGNPTRSYRVEFKDDLNASAWSPLVGAISWNSSTASIIDMTGTAQRFYRVVRLP